MTRPTLGNSGKISAMQPAAPKAATSTQDMTPDSTLQFASGISRTPHTGPRRRCSYQAPTSKAATEAGDRALTSGSQQGQDSGHVAAHAESRAGQWPGSQSSHALLQGTGWGGVG